MHISTAGVSAIVSADDAGPETHTGARTMHTAATAVQESCKPAQGHANAVIYKAQHSTSHTTRKSTPHMLLLRAIRMRVHSQAHGCGGTKHADRLEPGETISWPHPDFEHALSMQGPQCGLEELEDLACGLPDRDQDGPPPSRVVLEVEKHHLVDGEHAPTLVRLLLRVENHGPPEATTDSVLCGGAAHVNST